MNKHLSTITVALLVGTFAGFAQADMNGDQPQTPAVMKTTYTMASPMTMNANGVPKLVVEFQTDHWDIQPSFKSNVDAFGKYLVDHPTSQAEIAAYADHTGHGPANVTLAQKRADAVAAYLVSTFSISADRVKARGYGEVSDKAHNITPASRQGNRTAVGTITELKS